MANRAKTAVLVDAHFFLRRYSALTGDAHSKTGDQIARSLFAGILSHLRVQRRRKSDLYRVFVYDCPPLEKRIQNPVTERARNLGESSEAIQRFQFHHELRRLRKVAIRLGRYADEQKWMLDPKVLKPLLRGDIAIEDLSENDVYYDIRQKGVDMKIGIDIASLAYKQQVDQIILIAGDSDFVPAAKLARREGIDFLLDPMWSRTNPDLAEHIDGMQSPWPRPQP